MQESISNFSEKISVFLDKNHDIAFLIFIGVFVFLLIGNILNWKWTYEPKSWVGYHWLELLGRDYPSDCVNRKLRDFSRSFFIYILTL